MYSRRLTSALLEESVRAGTALEKGTPLGIMNRPVLTKSLSKLRNARDYARSFSNIQRFDKDDRQEATRVANTRDNIARKMSQDGNSNVPILSVKDVAKGKPDAQQPRLYSSKPNHK